MIEILIPTFNRSEFLIKNIQLLNKLITEEGLLGKYRILVSNNGSNDNTSFEVFKIKPLIDVELIYYEHSHNIGLEKNVVFLLENAKADYVMFLGDDDYLPSGYLSAVSSIVLKNYYGVVIPGFSSLFPDGTIKIGRDDMRTRSHSPGFRAIYDFSNFGHQLSGLLFERRDVIHKYTSDEKNRNIYLFIYFISYIMKYKPSLYIPDYQVLVSQGNSKDWGYDESGLLIEIFKNYKSLYPKNNFKRIALCVQMINTQSWRVRASEKWSVSLNSFNHLLSSKEIDFLLKCLLPIIFVILRSKKYLESNRFIKRVRNRLKLILFRTKISSGLKV